MKRAALAGGGLAVAALLGLVVIETSRGERSTPADAPTPTEAAPAPVRHPADVAPRQTPAVEPAPAELPAATAEVRARVAAERQRPDFQSPNLVIDHKLKAVPLRDARDAYQQGRYDLALQRAQDALAVEPTSNAARVLAAQSACAMGELVVARSHAQKLDPMRRARVAERCRSLGVDLDGGEPRRGE